MIIFDYPWSSLLSLIYLKIFQSSSSQCVEICGTRAGHQGNLRKCNHGNTTTSNSMEIQQHRNPWKYNNTKIHGNLTTLKSMEIREHQNPWKYNNNKIHGNTTASKSMEIQQHWNLQKSNNMEIPENARVKCARNTAKIFCEIVAQLENLMKQSNYKWGWKYVSKIKLMSPNWCK